METFPKRGSAPETPSTRPRDPALGTHRALISVGSAIYLSWWGAVEVFTPGNYNPFLGRFACVLACWLIFGASYAVPAVARHIRLGFSASLWLLTAHYFYLFHRNSSDINWVIGSYVMVMAGCAGLDTVRAFLAYSGWVAALGTAIVTLHPAVLHSVFLPGLLTVLAFALLGLRTRRALLDRNMEARVLYETSQEMVRMRDEFLSIASHELKTPLTTVKLATGLALHQIRAGGVGALRPEQVRVLVEQLDRQADRLTRLVEEMLDVSRIAAGRLAMNRAKVDLGALVRDVAESFQPGLGSAAASLRIETPPEPVEIYADAFRLEQVVSNLLSNAFKYGRGKPVRLRVERVPGGGGKIICEDHGIGIAPESHARIFGRFERATSSDKYNGLGLGLYIARQIVDAHDGRISVESRPEEGARFTVELPGASADV